MTLNGDRPNGKHHMGVVNGSEGGDVHAKHHGTKRKLENQDQESRYKQRLWFQEHEVETYDALAESVTSDGREVSHPKLAIIMVGLPARGKSYITKKLCRYLNWLQHETKIFNVGNMRRKLNHASDQPGEHAAGFFDPENKEAKKFRETAALSTLDDLLEYLLSGTGSVAIFDATNSTIPRRQLMVEKIAEKSNNKIQVLFLESQCFDQELLGSNIKLKLSGPDYQNSNSATALADFKDRITMYEKAYAPLGPHEENRGWSYCQMIDVGRKFVIHRIQGLLSNQTVQYLQNFHLQPRQIWLTRHGQTYDDVVGRIGGNSDLTIEGLRYSAALAKFISYRRKIWNETHQTINTTNTNSIRDFLVWTSNVRRSKRTASYFDPESFTVAHLKMLDELNAGILEGLTRDEIKEYYAEWHSSRQSDKLRHRYPGDGGEGYLDLTNRVKSVILEVERLHDHVLLISGLAVTRVLLAYFRGLSKEQMTDFYVPIGTLYLLEPEPYGVAFKQFTWDPANEWFEESTL